MAKAAPASLSASLLAVPKGAAAPATDPAPPEPEKEGEGAQQPVIQAQPPIVHAPTYRRTAPEIAPPPFEEPRTALTVRLPVNTQERLREAAHRTRREKQAIVDEALSVWFDEHGF